MNNCPFCSGLSRILTSESSPLEGNICTSGKYTYITGQSIALRTRFDYCPFCGRKLDSDVDNLKNVILNSTLSEKGIIGNRVTGFSR